jgi:hypothetical protein
MVINSHRMSGPLDRFSPSIPGFSPMKTALGVRLSHLFMEGKQ